MEYEVVILPSAQKELEGLDRQPVIKRLRAAIMKLREDPRPRGATKLAGRDGWRIRVGDYRVIYDIDDVVRIVSVEEVGHRRDVYRR